MFGGAFGIWQWLIVLAIVLLLFGGRGKISSLMGDFGKGLRNFKTGVKGEEDASDDMDDDEAEMIAEEKPARPAKKTRAASTKKASTTRSKASSTKKTSARKTAPRKTASRKKTSA
jgi:sec-independent protein translocase protein TatA